MAPGKANDRALKEMTQTLKTAPLSPSVRKLRRPFENKENLGFWDAQDVEEKIGAAAKRAQIEPKPQEPQPERADDGQGVSHPRKAKPATKTPRKKTGASMTTKQQTQQPIDLSKVAAQAKRNAMKKRDEVERLVHSEAVASVSTLVQALQRRLLREQQEVLSFAGTFAPLLVANVDWRTRNSLTLFGIIGVFELLTEPSLRIMPPMWTHLCEFILNLGVTGTLLHQLSTQGVTIGEKTGEFLLVDPGYKLWRDVEKAEGQPEPQVSTLAHKLENEANLPVARIHLLTLAALINHRVEDEAAIQSALVHRLSGVMFGLWYREGDKDRVVSQTDKELELILSESSKFDFNGATPWPIKAELEKEERQRTKAEEDELARSGKLSTELRDAAIKDRLDLDALEALSALHSSAKGKALATQHKEIKGVIAEDFSLRLRLLVVFLLSGLTLGRFESSGAVATAIVKLAYPQLKPSALPVFYAYLVECLFCANLNSRYVAILHTVLHGTHTRNSQEFKKSIESVHDYINSNVGLNEKAEHALMQAVNLAGGANSQSQLSSIVAMIKTALSSLPRRPAASTFASVPAARDLNAAQEELVAHEGGTLRYAMNFHSGLEHVRMKELEQRMHQRSQKKQQQHHHGAARTLPKQQPPTGLAVAQTHSISLGEHRPSPVRAADGRQPAPPSV